MFENFTNALNTGIDNIVKLIGELSDDRREWMRKRVANSLLFGAASSFVFYSRAKKSRESALNQAIALRNAATPFYEGDEERLAADIEGVVRYYSPKPKVEVDRKKGARKLPKAVQLRQEAIAKKVEADNEFREKLLPKLEGFLGGAKYDMIDLAASEMEREQAHRAITKAVEAMSDRCEQDITFCSQKWLEADQADNAQEVARWEAELLFAESDAQFVKDFAKQYNYSDDS